MPGHCGRQRFSPTITAMAPSATATDAGETVPRAAHSASTLGTISAGSPPGRVSPRRGRSWLAKMMTAIPAVKPTVTG